MGSGIGKITGNELYRYYLQSGYWSVSLKLVVNPNSNRKADTAKRVLVRFMAVRMRRSMGGGEKLEVSRRGGEHKVRSFWCVNV